MIVKNYGGSTGKVVIFGAGYVGSTAAYALMMSGLTSEIILVDIDEKKASGEAMDLSHSASFVSPVKITAGEYKDCTGAGIVVITAGVAQKPGETRIDLVNRNVEVFQSILPELLRYCPESIYLIVTNPVDILTAVTLKISGLPKGKVIGSGTVLDTSRFRYLLSNHCQVDPRNIHAYVIGEHGDTEVPVWSHVNVGGALLETFCRLKGLEYSEGWKEQIRNKVRRAAYAIIESKGYTSYAVGLAILRIVQSILRDENALLTVSTQVDYYDLDGICLGMPSVIGKNGVSQVLPLPLNQEEEEALRYSGETLRQILNKVKYN